MLHKSYFFYQPFFCLSVESEGKVAKRVDDAAKTPDVGAGVVLRPIQHLGSLICQGAHIFYQRAAAVVGCSDPEIANLDGVILALQKDIRWLNVSMDYVLRMHVIKCQKQLNNELFNPGFRQQIAFLVPEVNSQITFITIIKQYAKVILRTKMRLKPNYVWMLDPFHELALTQLIV
jgi:hypothetical protein